MHQLCPVKEFMPFNNKGKGTDGFIRVPEAIYMHKKSQDTNCSAGPDTQV